MSGNERERHEEMHAADRAAENNTALTPSSATVSAAQRSLRKRGFYKGTIDGQMGAETAAAIREYQRNSNLRLTGRIDRETLESLGVAK